jgi:rubrerythrin
MSLFERPYGALSQVAVVTRQSEALLAALGFEKETLLFYYELREVLRDAGRLVLDDIIQEEKRHIRRLSEVLRE